MKKLFAIIMVFCSLLMNGQELSKKEFNNFYLETDKIRELIINGQVDGLGEKLEISNLANFEDLKNVFAIDKVDFNNKTTHTHAHPYFYLTPSKNVLELTIPGMRILERRNGEDFERAKYYFVIQTDVEFNWDKHRIDFKNGKLITDESKIEEWWLGQYKNYMTEVRKVLDKFGYKPPPPASPPANLK